MNFRALAWLGLGLAPVAFGGVLIGNGGHALVCRDPDRRIRSAELFDYYEARVQSGLVAKLGDDALPYPDKVRIALARLAVHSPKRAARYLEQAQSFVADATFLSPEEARLRPIPDRDADVGNLIEAPPGCAIEQLAIQHIPKYPSDKRYFVQAEIWSALDEQSRAGLVLHEVIYREALDSFQTNSLNARYFNAFLSQTEFPAMDGYEFLLLLRDRVGFLEGELFGHDVLLARCPVETTTSESGHPRCERTPVRSALHRFRRDEGDTLVVDLARTQEDVALGNFSVYLGFVNAGPVDRFDPVRATFRTGRLIRLEQAQSSQIFLADISLPMAAGGLNHASVDDKGQLRTLDWRGDLPLSFRVGQRLTKFLGPAYALARRPDSRIYSTLMTFFPKLQVESGFLAESITLPDPQGRETKLPAGSWIQVDAEGRLIDSILPAASR